MTAYYNEFDLYAAKWLGNLITAGLIAPGVVDTRSIEDVFPSDLTEFTQCHFFAGVGVWSYALRAAGWPDDRPIWTGSCPCQPFSAAGKGAGFDDERHLWPAFHHLIKERRPATVLGEQVASSAVDDWIDLVHADMEAMGYAFGSVPFPSAGVGAPHIRDRNYWVANSIESQRGRRPNNGALLGNRATARRKQVPGDAKRRSAVDRMADDNGIRFGAGTVSALHDAEHHVESRGSVRGLADTDGGANRRKSQILARGNVRGLAASDGSSIARLDAAGPTNGFWRDADWLGCTDGKWRPVEPGTFPLVNGAPARVGRLRAYGNAINAEQARIWIETVMECQP